MVIINNLRKLLVSFFGLETHKFPVAKFIVPDWGDKVESAYRPTGLFRLAGRYDNPLPGTMVYGWGNYRFWTVAWIKGTVQRGGALILWRALGGWGAADFSKNLPRLSSSLMKAYWMSLISAGSISLDSTFNIHADVFTLQGCSYQTFLCWSDVNCLW